MTSSDAAQLLGVSPASVKRWADSGLLPCVKTAGSHRRFRRHEVEAFRQNGASPAPPGAARGWLAGWLDTLLRDANPLAVAHLLLVERARLGAWWRVADALDPVLVELGRRWQAGEIATVDEHEASERFTRGVARCAEMLSAPSAAPHALLASADGDDHTLGLRLVELCLRDRGINVDWAGAPTPTSAVVERLARGRVSIVALSASVASSDARDLARQARLLATACRKHGADLILGGRGAWPERPSHGLRMTSFAELESYLRRWD